MSQNSYQNGLGDSGSKKQTAEQLTYEIGDLRQSLKNINKALIDAQNSKMIDAKETMDIEKQDIHPSSVIMLERSTMVQNYDLSLEIANQTRILQSALKEKNELQTETASLTQEIEQLTSKEEQDKAGSDTLLKEREEANLKFDQLTKEASEWRQKAQTIEYLLQNTMKQNESKRHEAYKQIALLDAEIQALKEVNYPLNVRLGDLEKGDIDKARDEVRKSSQTIQELTKQVEELSKKLKMQREQHVEQTNVMNASVLALQSPQKSRQLIGQTKTSPETNTIKSQLQQLKRTNEELQSRLNYVTASQLAMTAPSQDANQAQVAAPYKIGQIDSSNLSANVYK